MVELATGQPLYNYLLLKPTITSHRNLVNMYVRNDVDLLYMSLSTSCTAAAFRMEEIDKTDRLILPSRFNFINSRSVFLEDKEMARLASEIMGDDWRK